MLLRVVVFESRTAVIRVEAARVVERDRDAPSASSALTMRVCVRCGRQSRRRAMLPARMPGGRPAGERWRLRCPEWSARHRARTRCGRPCRWPRGRSSVRGAGSRRDARRGNCQPSRMPLLARVPLRGGGGEVRAARLVEAAAAGVVDRARRRRSGANPRELDAGVAVWERSHAPRMGVCSPYRPKSQWFQTARPVLLISAVVLSSW